jgi:hypothetical protein
VKTPFRFVIKDRGKDVSSHAETQPIKHSYKHDILDLKGEAVEAI